jgi:hypothetical protein
MSITVAGSDYLLKYHSVRFFLTLKWEAIIPELAFGWLYRDSLIHIIQWPLCYGSDSQ